MQTNDHEEDKNNKEEESSNKPKSCWEIALLVVWIFIAVVVFIFGACFIVFAID